MRQQHAAIVASMLQQQKRLERLNEMRDGANTAIQLYGLFWTYSFFRKNPTDLFSGYEGTEITILPDEVGLRMKFEIAY